MAGSQKNPRAQTRGGNWAPTSVLSGRSLKQAKVSPSAMPVVGRVQGAHVCVPTAAASLVPVLDHYGEFEPLAEMLRRGVEKPQPEELEGEGQGGEAKA